MVFDASNGLDLPCQITTAPKAKPPHSHHQLP
jgi:hypothetical protein